MSYYFLHEIEANHVKVWLVYLVSDWNIFDILIAIT